MPSPQEQERPFEVTALEQTDTSITLQVGRSAHEVVVFTYTPPYKVEFDFPGKEATAEAVQLQTQEIQKPPEFPAISIEGNPAKAAKYVNDNHTYFLRLA